MGEGVEVKHMASNIGPPKRVDELSICHCLVPACVNLSTTPARSGKSGRFRKQVTTGLHTQRATELLHPGD